MILHSGKQITSKFSRTLHAELGTRLDLSTTFHPQNNSHMKRTIQVLEDMLRAYVIDFDRHWDHFLPLEEFSYNNIYHSSIYMSPFELLDWRRCRSHVGSFDAFKVRTWVTDLFRASLEKVNLFRRCS